MTRLFSASLLLTFASLSAGAATVAVAQEPIDRATLARIRDEGLNRSQVAETFNHLTNVVGPRLTGTPAYKQAADWAEARFKTYGLKGIHQETFPFGRGWTLKKFVFEMVEPRYMPLIGYPEAWTPSTKGEIVAAPVYIGDLADSTAVRAQAAKLKGAIVLGTQAQDRFITTDRLEPSLTDSSVRIGAPPFLNPRGPVGGRGAANVWRDVSPGVVLRPTQGQHGTMFVLGNRATQDDAAPTVIVASEQYNMIVNAMKAGSPVKLRVAIESKYETADTNGYNVLAEIPGTDRTLGSEIVLIGAHLDSWHSATGATDNADASASLIEAARILAALGVKPKRTIRFALWGGEEEGLLGSRAYAQKHFAGDANAAARDKLAVYLNSDPGSGPIFGWYMEENAAAKTIFDAWLDPFKDLGARRNVIAKIGSTDHLAFTAIGVPAFNSLQDYVEYDQREHHTNMDFADRVLTKDLQQNAVVLASFAWMAAQRDQKIPRVAPIP
jgi:carboxypeptidase Q